jgi:glucose-1-phosphate cytidylyltransferase
MKAVILAGGMGTRISEESNTRPKPMIEIGGKPILWHIMKGYTQHGITDFVICLGYKGYIIKEYFANYFLHMSDVTFDMRNNKMEIHQRNAEPWRITLVDTGEATMTGGRIRQILPYVKDDDAFCLTYGDGVGNVDITSLIKFHRQQKTLCTLTAVQPPGRFGALVINDLHQINSFQEKPKGDGGWINGGFFVCAPEVIKRISGDSTIWEREPMESLAREGQMSAFHHYGFWQPMDTLRDKMYLEDLWSKNAAPWKVW